VFRNFSEQFYTDANRPSDLASSYGRGIIMSMQHHKPDQAVLADSWTLFCPECSQKMRIIMAAPTHDGRETRTYECIYGHRDRVTVALY
jgi:hypothetical protein